MKATSHEGPTLERRQPAARLDPRMALRRLRVALGAVVTKYPQPDWPWEDNARKEPRSPAPCEKEREMLTAAIRQGCTTRDRVLTYYLLRIQDSMAQFPDAAQFALSDILYVRAMAEQAEALEAQARARALPSPEHCEVAARETREAMGVQELLVATYERGDTLPFPPFPAIR
jgi:hypothetical protein